ncbi:PilZ domain-containing protein [Sphingomonas sp.]|uniref:PilZ domain-containing protein n=1 Tax=Sphingomonas sp. TaxID=28214 RepID=UPI001EB91FD2|nr:PilZ domain-containing protein [Sphingomonas sp.]MBX3593060.1 PilZ domain-containing protein [Sphingomonas sp.]
MTVAARSAIFSLSDDLDLAATGGHAHAAPARFTGGDGGARDCFVHRIAAGGATLTVSGPVGANERATIDLPCGLSAEGAFAAVEQEVLTFRFDQPIDIVGALARCLAAQTAERRQMPRIELRQRVCLRHSGQVDFAWTRNLSPTGVGLETRTTLDVGERVELTLDGLRPLTGEVRWAEHGHAGIAFDEELGWQMLMPWLRKIKSAPPAKHRAADPFPPPSALGAVKDALRLDIATHVRAGAKWWNARIHVLSNALVEFESATEFTPLSSLWLSLPEIGGWPIRVIECHGERHVAEFRLPLRPHEMARLTEALARR